MRSAVVAWLERLVVVRKVSGSSPARAKRLENSHYPPSGEWVGSSPARAKRLENAHCPTLTVHPAANGYLINFRVG